MVSRAHAVMVSSVHAGEREAWCPVEVHPFQKEVLRCDPPHRTGRPR